MPNYSLEALPERAARARERHADYVDKMLRGYVERTERRKMSGILPIAFCGHGRAGKDAGAEYLCNALGWIYPQSNSWLVRPLIADMADITPDRAYEERHQNRHFWVHACHALRAYDLGFLVKLSLGVGDVAVGIRGDKELASVKQDGTVALTVWIENPRVPEDPTVEYEEGDCDLSICNSGSLVDFYAKLDTLAKLIRRGVHKE